MSVRQLSAATRTPEPPVFLGPRDTPEDDGVCRPATFSRTRESSDREGETHPRTS